MQLRVAYKNTYPYSTVHDVRCLRGLNARSSYILEGDRLARFDTIRTDFCKVCFDKDYYDSPLYGQLRAVQNEARAAAARGAAVEAAAIEYASLIIQAAEMRGDPDFTEEARALARSYIGDPDFRPRVIEFVRQTRDRATTLNGDNS